MVLAVYIRKGTDANMANMATLENLANPLATPDGGDPHILLGPLGAFLATIPFEPSVF